MTSEHTTPRNLSTANSDDKATWHTIGCRIRPSDLFLVDKAVMEIRHGSGRMNYNRSDFISESVVERAMRILKDQHAEAAA